MRIWTVALWTVIATSLPAQEDAPGFKWIGVRAGSTSFDPKEYLKAATSFGAQGGLLFDQQRYGLSLEALSSQPTSSLPPNKKLTYHQYSLSLLSGLRGDSPSAFWPYVGLGLGSSSVAKVNVATQVVETNTATSAHASFGLLHRPFQHVIWGVEGRYLVTFSNPGMNAFQGSAMVGFSWGGAKASRPAADRRPNQAPVQTPPPAPAQAPPAPLPVVETVPPPPVVAAPVTAPAPKPLPVVTAPRPMAAEPVPVPAPPPAPTPVSVPAPAPVVAAPVAPTLKVAPAKPAAPVPVPAAARPTTSDAALTERLDALLLGDMAKAVDLGRKRIEALPARRWTIRLEIANLPATLKNAVVAFPGRKPDLFIAPIKLRGGRTAYQLFLGDYATKAEAEQAARSVPAVFLEGGSRPKPFLIGEIPSQVGR